MRTTRTITYHGRSGRPVIHKANSRRYMMVRRKGGGVKRLYEGSKYRTNHQTRRLRLR